MSDGEWAPIDHAGLVLAGDTIRTCGQTFVVVSAKYDKRKHTVRINGTHEISGWLFEDGAVERLEP